MNVNGASGNAQVNWETLLSALNGPDNAGKTVSVDKASQTVTFTVAGEDGVARAVTASIPDLDIPESVDQTALDTLAAKLTELSKAGTLSMSETEIKELHSTLTATLGQLAPASNAVTGKASKTVMFDIYALMAILVEVAQKQRDATREMRLAENKSVQSSIMAQADQQKQAALVGMIAGVTCCALQAAVSIGTLVKMGNAFKTQVNELTSGNIASAKQDVTMLRTAAESPQKAQSQLSAITDEVGNVADTVKAEGFGRAEQSFDKLTDLDAQNNADAQTLEKVQNYRQNGAPLRSADLPDGELKTALQAQEANQAKIDGIKSKIGEEAYGNLKALEGSSKPGDKAFVMEAHKQLGIDNTSVNELEAESVSLKAKVDAAAAKVEPELKAKVDSFSARFEAARLEVRQEVGNAIKGYDDAYENALFDKQNLPKDATPEQIAEADAKIETAATELKFARAQGYEMLSRNVGGIDITTHAESEGAINAANERVTGARNETTSSIKYMKAARALAEGETANMLINSIGNAVQSFISNLTQMQQAEATKIGAQTKKSEEDLDQTKDLFGQAQTLVNDVVQLMQAVIQAESQSLRDAIHA